MQSNDVVIDVTPFEDESPFDTTSDGEASPRYISEDEMKAYTTDAPINGGFKKVNPKLMKTIQKAREAGVSNDEIIKSLMSGRSIDFTDKQTLAKKKADKADRRAKRKAARKSKQKNRR